MCARLCSNAIYIFELENNSVRKAVIPLQFFVAQKVSHSKIELFPASACVIPYITSQNVTISNQLRIIPKEILYNQQISLDFIPSSVDANQSFDKGSAQKWQDLLFICQKRC